MNTQSLAQAWPSDVAEEEITPGDLIEAVDAMDWKIKRTDKWRTGDVLDQCRDYVEEGVRDDLDDGVIFMSLDDPHEAGQLLANITEKHLIKFVENNFDAVQEYCEIGKYAEVDE